MTAAEGWEYVLVQLGNVRSQSDLEAAGSKLELLGRQGWEAVTTVGDPLASVVLFKRSLGVSP